MEKNQVKILKIFPQKVSLYLPPAPAGDASEGVSSVWPGGEGAPTVSMTSAPALSTSCTQLAGVETADTQRQREGKLQTADRSATPPDRAMFRPGA